jgi:hypothetical protein
MGNRETNRNVAKRLIYNDLTVRNDGARRDILAQ